MAGGGISLNFKIVGGTTQPTSPTENTIWVNTSDTITGYEFSSSQPTSPYEGMIWVDVSTSSSLAFDALKKKNESIYVYPISCRQYINGVAYQNDEWRLAQLILYRNGTRYTTWNEAAGWQNTSGTVETSGSVSWGATAVTIECHAVTGLSWASTYTIYTNTINLSSYKTLEVVVDVATNTKGSYWIGITSDTPTGLYVDNTLPTNILTGADVTTAKTYTIDLSILSATTGNIVLWVHNQNTSGANPQMTISSVILKP